MNDRARARGSETKPPPATCGASAGPGPRTHLGWRARCGWGPGRGGSAPRSRRQPPASSARRGEGGRPTGRASELAVWGCGGGRGHRAHSAPGAGERLSGRPRLALAPASPRGRDPRRSGGDSAPPPTRGYAARAADCVESAAAAAAAAGGGDARSHVSPRSGPGAPVPLALQASPASRAPAARGPSLVARLPQPRVAAGPRPACSPPVAPPPCPLDARAASARSALGAQGGGPPARRGPWSQKEQSLGEAARAGPREPPSGRRSRAERGGCCCGEKDVSIPRGFAKDERDPLRSWRQISC